MVEHLLVMKCSVSFHPPPSKERKARQKPAEDRESRREPMLPKYPGKFLKWVLGV